MIVETGNNTGERVKDDARTYSVNSAETRGPKPQHKYPVPSIDSSKPL